MTSKVEECDVTPPSLPAKEEENIVDEKCSTNLSGETESKSTEDDGLPKVCPPVEPCGNFELDVAATTFNICKNCHLPKAAHINFSRASTELKGKLDKRDEINKSRRIVQEEGSKCCNNFRRDLSGTTFDMCVCGFIKSDHVKKKTYDWCRQ
mmetsp:Transcript_18730/g.28239  ORF Transcript_18730/g.28239 Transcript_18730/m.28239 type:complete len:152 (-) Transcript_18730:2479-2934(-)